LSKDHEAIAARPFASAARAHDRPGVGANIAALRSDDMALGFIGQGDGRSPNPPQQTLLDQEIQPRKDLPSDLSALRPVPWHLARRNGVNGLPDPDWLIMHAPQVVDDGRIQRMEGLESWLGGLYPR
jgi:hypothetical protein